MMRLRLARRLFQILRQRLRDHVLDLGAHIGVVQLALGLALELRLRQLHADRRGQALANVVASQIGVGLFELPVLRPYSLSVRVSAARKPVTCEPPSTVLMPLAKEKSVSL